MDAVQKTNYIEASQKIFPNYRVTMFENFGNLVARANNIKRFMKENLKANPLKGQEKYALVCHSTIIAALTSDGLEDPTNQESKLVNPTMMLNCQSLPFIEKQ